MNHHTRCITVTCFFALLFFSWTVYGQVIILDKSLENYKLPSNMKEYFQNKYPNQIDEVECRLEETPQGPKGYLQVKGHIVLNNHNDIPREGDERIRSIARTFLAEESGVLGLPDMNEWHEASIHYEPRSKNRPADAQISYKRYLNDIQFAYVRYVPWIILTIGKDDVIYTLTAYLSPLPSEAYRAASSSVIARKKAEHVVQQDMNEQGLVSLKIKSLDLFVTDMSPYIIWTAYCTDEHYVSWHYVINATTGEIVRKSKVKHDDPGC